MSAFNVAEKALSKAQNLLQPQAQEIQTDFLTVRGNILEFRAKQKSSKEEKVTFYQISNMSSVEVLTLKRNFPLWTLIGVGFGMFLTAFGWFLGLIGLLIGLVCGAFLVVHAVKPQTYGMLLLLNAGPASSVMITCPERPFLIKVARTLSELMTEKLAGEVIFNTQSQEITMRDVTGAFVNTGEVHGGAFHSPGPITDEGPRSSAAGCLGEPCERRHPGWDRECRRRRQRLRGRRHPERGIRRSFTHRQLRGVA